MAKRSYLSRVVTARGLRSRSGKAMEEDEETKYYDRAQKSATEVDDTRDAIDALYRTSPKSTIDECAPGPTETQQSEASISSVVIAQMQELEVKLGVFQAKLNANEAEMRLRSLENTELRRLVTRLQNEVAELGGTDLMDTTLLERRALCSGCATSCTLF
jgi:hypothetical protein